MLDLEVPHSPTCSVATGVDYLYSCVDGYRFGIEDKKHGVSEDKTSAKTTGFGLECDSDDRDMGNGIWQPRASIGRSSRHKIKLLAHLLSASTM